MDNRTADKKIGFGSSLTKNKDVKYEELIKQLQPGDLIKFGLIPEFVGRLPIVVGLNPLDEEALVKILTEPKNALTKQYKVQFDMDGVELVFEDDAVLAVAQKAISLNTGARGLRAILEETLLDLMFEIPSRKDVKRIIVTRESIENKDVKPRVEYVEKTEPKSQTILVETKDNQDIA